MWREFNRKTIKYIVENHDGTIIVPMTITDISYFEEITGNLESEKIELHKFVLSASKEVIESRLKKRLERKKIHGALSKSTDVSQAWLMKPLEKK